MFQQPVAKASMLFDSSFSSVGHPSVSHFAAKDARFAFYACIKTEANGTWEVILIMTLHRDHLCCITDSVRHIDDRKKNRISQDRNPPLASIWRNATTRSYSWCSFEAFPWTNAEHFHLIYTKVLSLLSVLFGPPPNVNQMEMAKELLKKWPVNCYNAYPNSYCHEHQAWVSLLLRKNGMEPFWSLLLWRRKPFYQSKHQICIVQFFPSSHHHAKTIFFRDLLSNISWSYTIIVSYHHIEIFIAEQVYAICLRKLLRFVGKYICTSLFIVKDFSVCLTAINMCYQNALIT